jgi:hypothetical protein
MGLQSPRLTLSVYLEAIFINDSLGFQSDQDESKFVDFKVRQLEINKILTKVNIEYMYVYVFSTLPFTHSTVTISFKGRVQSDFKFQIRK